MFRRLHRAESPCFGFSARVPSRIHTASGGTPSTRMARKTKDLAEAYPAACAEAKARPSRPSSAPSPARSTPAPSSRSSVSMATARSSSTAASTAAQRLAIASALTGTATVEEVDLSYNRIDDAGAEAIAAMLARSPAVRRLDLRGNDIGPEGAAHIARALAATGDRISGVRRVRRERGRRVVVVVVVVPSGEPADLATTRSATTASAPSLDRFGTTRR